MKIIAKQEGFALKFNRQAELLKYSDKYKLHCNGACAHYGKIPRGCASCLFNTVYATGVYLGCGFGFKNVCNANCKHCFTKLGSGLFDRTFGSSFSLPDGWEKSLQEYFKDEGTHGRYEILGKSMILGDELAMFSFGGEGSEPLFYLPVIEKTMEHLKSLEPELKKKHITYKLYTNGKLLTENVIDSLVKFGINELRVNPSAFGFSDEIFKNIENACKKIDVVTTEVGVFPQYFDNIMKMLPRLEEIGVSHISLCQPKYKDYEVLKENVHLFPEDAYCYPASNDWIVVDDFGMSEAIFKEVIDKNYSFSVMDCNCMMLAQEKQDFNVGKDLNNPDFFDVINI